jgi:hypothetical protein
MQGIGQQFAKLRSGLARPKLVDVRLPGKLFLPSDERETDCRVTSLWADGAKVDCQIAPGAGSQIVLYVDGFGRFEGSVARKGDGGFEAAFNCSPLKRERTEELLAAYRSNVPVESRAMRRHERMLTKGFARFTRADGQLVPCEVLDLSPGGVSLKTEVKPPEGEYVLIGQLAGRVAHHHEHGIGIEFVGNIADRQNAERVKAKLNISR